MRYWIVKGKPSENDLEAWLNKGGRGSWRTSRPPKDWAVGDRLFFWEGSPALCVVGLGCLESIAPNRDEFGDIRFGVSYQTKYLTNPVSIFDLRADPIVSEAYFLKRGPAGTVFRLTEDQARKTYELVVTANETFRNVWPDLAAGFVDAGHSQIPAEACDSAEPPERTSTTICRIIRDTAKARELKRRYGWKCQGCGQTIQISANELYAEVHHVRPLGGKHRGLDVESNMLVLCPNHHAMFDFGIPKFRSVSEIDVQGKISHLTTKHDLSEESVAYHNNSIWRKTTQA